MKSNEPRGLTDDEKNLEKIISSIKDLASSFCSNSEEVRKEVTSMSGKTILDSY